MKRHFPFVFSKINIKTMSIEESENMKLIKSEKGQSMVETALVLPLILLLLFGIFDFGWLFYNKLQVQNCAREGARFAAVNYDIDNDVKSKDDIKKYVKDMEMNGLTFDIDVNATADGVHKNGYLTVVIKTDVPTMTPIIGAFFPDGKCHMKASTTMYREKTGEADKPI